MDTSNIAFQMDNFIQWLELSTSRSSMRQLLRFFRQTRNAKFLELCRVHLSFLLDSPRDYLEGQEVREDLLQEAVGSEKRRFFRSILAKLFKRSKDVNKSLADGGSVISRLIKHLMCHHDTLVEGIFRKTGNVSKQKQLKKQLTSDPLNVTDLSEHLVHDLACVLKSLLVDWPLLTEEIRRVFLAMSLLRDRQQNSQEPPALAPTCCLVPQIPNYTCILDRLSLAKRKKGYRLLCLLLPDTKREVFFSLLRLLRRVAQSPVTKMTPETLGTLFGPLIFASPRESSATLRDKYRSYGVVVQDLITMVTELDEIPISLLVDVEKNLATQPISPMQFDVENSDNKMDLGSRGLKSHWTGSHYSTATATIPTRTREESAPLHTCVRFAMSPSQHTACSLQTDEELGRLIGVIRGMPDACDRKRRYLRRLNRTVQSRSPYPEKAVAATPESKLTIHDFQPEKRRAGMRRFLSSCVSKTHLPCRETTAVAAEVHSDRKPTDHSYPIPHLTPLGGFKRWKSQCGVLDVSPRRLTLDCEDSSSVESFKFRAFSSPRTLENIFSPLTSSMTSQNSGIPAFT